MQVLGLVKMIPARLQVINILREAILSREIKEGTRLNLNELSSQMGVSVTPVREALQILEKDCLIRLEPHKGAVVLGINEKYINDYYVTRAILESEAASMACEEGANVIELQETFLKMKDVIEKDNYNLYASMNQQLHMAIWNAADNERMKSIMLSLFVSRSIAKDSDVKENAKSSFNEHKEIVTAILNKDKVLAKKCMYKHILRSMDDMLTRFY
ncbi:MAG: GntR family transcriptional regulator [Sedimentibacter sp.]|jgi:DNA-binding GntR family transcriptional regulator|nr:GntR family transcriptional regulator [Sedimentibacter sp.]